MEKNCIKLPDEIKDLIEIAYKNGEEAYLVGGSVRDILCLKRPYDFDLTISCLPEKTKEIYKNYKMWDIGIKYGTVSIMTLRGIVEITTYRTEDNYADFRHPESIAFARNLEEDLKRRDFTMNALAYNHKEGFVDLFGGTDDIKNSLIRCVGNPSDRFKEDPLRILRGIRFASTLDFHVEKETEKEMFKNFLLLENVSVERKRDEIVKMLTNSKNNEKILSKYEEIIKFAFGISSIETAKKTIDKTTETMVKIGLLLCDEDNVEKICKNLKYSKEMSRIMKTLKEYKEKELKTDLKSVRRLIKEYPQDADLIILFKLALGEDVKIALENYKKIKEENICCSLKQLAVNGKDLEKLNLFEKTQYKTVLNNLLDMVIDEKVPNEKESLINKIKTEF